MLKISAARLSFNVIVGGRKIFTQKFLVFVCFSWHWTWKRLLIKFCMFVLQSFDCVILFMSQGHYSSFIFWIHYWLAWHLMRLMKKFYVSWRKVWTSWQFLLNNCAFFFNLLGFSFELFLQLFKYLLLNLWEALLQVFKNF